MLQGLGHKEKIQDKDAKCKGVRWGHSYDDGWGTRWYFVTGTRQSPFRPRAPDQSMMGLNLFN